MNRLFFRNLVVIVLVFLFLVIYVGKTHAQTGDWPQEQSNSEHTNFNSASSITPTLYQHWKVQLGHSIGGYIVVNGVVYVTYGNTPTTIEHMQALNADTGAVMWSYTHNGDIISTPAYDQGSIYLSTANSSCDSTGSMVALDPSSGAVIWETNISHTPFSTPTVKNGKVFLSASGCGGAGQEFAFNASDGSILWNVGTSGGLTSVRTDGNLVYFNSYFSPKTWALDANTGSQVWTQGSGDGYQPFSLLANNTLYSGSSNGLFALDATTGSIVWQDGVQTSSFAYANGLLYAGNGNPTELDARNPQTGVVQWSQTLPGRPLYTSVANGHVFVSGATSTNFGLTVLNATTGAKESEFINTDGTAFITPVIGPNAVYVGSADNGNFYVLWNTPPNLAPVVNPLSGGTINQGGTYSENGSFTDSDSTSWTATVDYGDGSGVQPLTLSGMNFSLSHVYTTPGTYTETVAVTDNQGATGTGSASVVVNPVYSISGNVFNDANHNGVKDSGEGNSVGTTVTLSGASSASTTTDTSGNYSFPGLSSGSYTVTLTDPTGYGSTTTNPVNLTLSSNTTENFGITTTTDLKITPLADDFVSANNQTANYGTLDYLRVDSSPVKTAFLKYDLSSLTGKTITAVKFKVATYSDANSTTAGPVNVYLVNTTTWGETTLNYNNQPSVSTTLLGTLTNLTSTNTKYNFQLDPAGIQPETGAKLSLGITSNNGSQLHLYSREATNVDFTPKLVISYY